MSITFIPAANSEGKPLFRCNNPDSLDCQCRACTTYLNMSNTNAMEFLKWVGVTPEYHGTIRACDLAALCTRRLWSVARNVDPGVEPVTEGRFTDFGRPVGYFQDRAKQMLELCQIPGFEWISWS